MAKNEERELLTVGGREVAISNPRKVLFPAAGHTKLDLARYYLAVAEGALRGAGGRPNVLVRYPNGIDGEFFYQKRAPTSRPPWIDAVSLKFPSGRTAEEVVPRDAAALAWMANLACLELHPHPVRADDLDHPDELRVDLDPVPGVEWAQVREVAARRSGHARRSRTRRLAQDVGLARHPHLRPHRAALDVRPGASRGARAGARRRTPRASARDEQVVEGRAPRRLPRLQPEREGPHGLLGVLGAAEARRPRVGAAGVGRDRRLRSCRLHARHDARAVRAIGDRHADIDAHPCSLDALLELSARDEREGQGDAPWPPHYRKQDGEPPRVQPSKRRAAPAKAGGRRASTKPMLEIAQALKKEDALAGLERWKARHPDAAAHLEPADVLVDAMRGRFTTWTRIRVNLQHVPEALRPPQEAARSGRGPVRRSGRGRCEGSRLR